PRWFSGEPAGRIGRADRNAIERGRDDRGLPATKFAPGDLAVPVGVEIIESVDVAYRELESPLSEGPLESHRKETVALGVGRSCAGEDHCDEEHDQGTDHRHGMRS